MINHTTKKASAASIVLAVIAFAAFAQERTSPQQDLSQPRKATVLKNKAPVSKELLKVKRPKAQEATLKNGLRVLVLSVSVALLGREDPMGTSIQSVLAQAGME